MRAYFLAVTVLFALGACQAEETKSTLPTTQESVPVATQSAGSRATQVQVVAEQASAALNEAAVQIEAVAKETLAELQSKKVADATQAKEQINADVVSSLAESVSSAQTKQPSGRTEAAMSVMPSTSADKPVSAVPKSVLPAAAKPTPPAASSVAIVAIGDAGKGKVLARKCAACHSFETKNKMGPGLAGVLGREAGSVPGFKYQFTGFIQPGKVWRWDEAHLAAWVCNAKKAVKIFTGDAGAKTKMGAQRICDAAKQADMIAYLRTL